MHGNNVDVSPKTADSSDHLSFLHWIPRGGFSFVIHLLVCVSVEVEVEGQGKGVVILGIDSSIYGSK